MDQEDQLPANGPTTSLIGFGHRVGRRHVAFGKTDGRAVRSDAAGSSTAAFYDNCRSVVTADFSVEQGRHIHAYTLSLGVTSDQVLQRSGVTTNLFVI